MSVTALTIQRTRTKLGTLPLALVVFGVLLNGCCLTPELWEERAEYKPAADPRVDLRLKPGAPADVLLLYDEVDSTSGRVRRRALYLFANALRLAEGRKPAFVNPAVGDTFTPIPIFTKRPPETAVAPAELYAVSPFPMMFVLESRGRALLEFSLPRHDQWLTTRKFFLLPVAAAADAALLGAAAGVVIGMEAMAGGATFSFSVD